MDEKIDITVQKEEFTSTIDDKEKVKPLSKPKCSIPVRSHRRGFSIFLPPSGDPSKDPASQETSNKGFLPGSNFNREYYDTVDAGGPLARTPEDEMLEKIFSPRNRRRLLSEGNQPQQQTAEVEEDSLSALSI
ncbi:hypothetical protein [Legionella pneumophila]|uniref:Uncharacterized protein n=1 Tax=Legionella pneumophila subsp. pascullei TaxID=91890 RepID=A0AAX2IX45_LEGPN|nr:hypothetical protein [Legionella pneumophila]AMP89156.1 hypothetical protein AXF35_05440 [Legionella pneumophila subsp. pascullei]AMP93177.1 hypothetical protein AXF36_11355 [Legionella pneumophila subsp. pascullei]AMP96143.1 hypothetical protein AXF37_11245 [Legionella pneumophila subsp. pascullei]SQG91091.1 Uncharacterised protein [Legionella pneumophila subsp. pascullei]VEH07636.1 Uncharacterised protein [Legionella pneumophila subsp. pascullei]